MHITPATMTPAPALRRLPASITSEPYETLGGCTCDLEGPADTGGHAETCPDAPCACPHTTGYDGEPVTRHTAACLARY